MNIRSNRLSSGSPVLGLAERFQGVEANQNRAVFVHLLQRFEGVSTRRLTFEVEDGESFERTQNNGIAIRRKGYFLYLVALTDARSQAGPYVVQLSDDGGEWFGRCDCQGFRFHEGPCAHLWALKMAEAFGVIHVYTLGAALDAGEVCPTCGETPEEVSGYA